MCETPIWIRNRRYYDKRRSRNAFRLDDDHRSALALAPYDVARQWLLVPCGRCPDCLRRLRNDWYVRLERELAFCKAFHQQAVFITITISPKCYKDALNDPSSFIRKFNERLRHKLGHSFKHFYLQEFGEHPQTGGVNRLHFHGFMFGVDCSYNAIRDAVSPFGFIWISAATLKRARYVVKYVTKQITAYRPDGSVIPEGLTRKYTRKFVSPHVGDYVGVKPIPSATSWTWSYYDSSTRVTYNYSIPRYYDRYLSEKSKWIRALRSADAYARFSRNNLVKRIVDFLIETTLPKGALSCRDSYNWQNKKALEFSKVRVPDGAFNSLPILSWDILEFWKKSFNLHIPNEYLYKLKHLWQNNLSLVTS